MTQDEERNAAIDAMIDRQAITDCIMRYARGIDRHNTEIVASAYHEGALDDHTAYIGPGKQFGTYANATHDATWAAHQHYVTNISIELKGDEAHVESYWIVAGRRIADHSLDMHGGRYIDRLTKREGKWAIAARICGYEWGLRPEETASCLDHFPLGRQDQTDDSYIRPLQVYREPTC